MVLEERLLPEEEDGRAGGEEPKRPGAAGGDAGRQDSEHDEPGERRVEAQKVGDGMAVRLAAPEPARRVVEGDALPPEVAEHSGVADRKRSRYHDRADHDRGALPQGGATPESERRERDERRQGEQLHEDREREHRSRESRQHKSATAEAVGRERQGSDRQGDGGNVGRHPRRFGRKRRGDRKERRRAETGPAASHRPPEEVRRETRDEGDDEKAGADADDRMPERPGDEPQKEVEAGRLRGEDLAPELLSVA